LANELLIFHMKVADEEVDNFLTNAKNLELSIPPEVNFSNFDYLARLSPDKPLGVIYAIQSLGFDRKFNVPLETLCRFTLRVKKGYRDNPYHNWTHAFSVFHMAYSLVKNLNLQNILGDLACYSFLIAALCHDLDHRGTNSSFEVNSKSALASLYSSKGSVLERHHFAQTIALLSVDGCNVFAGMNSNDNQKALDYVQMIILATDLGQHLRILEDLKNLTKQVQDNNNFNNLYNNKNNNTENIEKLTLSLLMTASDLSDQSKDWDTTKATAKNIYEEFFNQGDREKDMGLKPLPSMDRTKAVVSDVQIAFMDNIATPVYAVLADLFPESEEILLRVKLNRERWDHIASYWNTKDLPATESMQILTTDIDKQVLGQLDNSVNPFS
jgi:cGMP-dependent 3',5'-cyclic phosphodiesterase